MDFTQLTDKLVTFAIYFILLLAPTTLFSMLDRRLFVVGLGVGLVVLGLLMGTWTILFLILGLGALLFFRKVY